MPLTLYKRRTLDGRDIWHYRGTVAGDRLRGTTGTTNRKDAARIAAAVERRVIEGGTPAAKGALTFPQAVVLYLKAGKSDQYLDKIEDYWKNTKVRNMAADHRNKP